jgi:hypothetical protein
VKKINKRRNEWRVILSLFLVFFEMSECSLTLRKGSSREMKERFWREQIGRLIKAGAPRLRLLRRGSERRTQATPKRAGPSALFPFF